MFIKGKTRFGLLINWDAKDYEATKEQLETLGAKIVEGGEWKIVDFDDVVHKYCALVIEAPYETFAAIKKDNNLAEVDGPPIGVIFYAGV